MGLTKVVWTKMLIFSQLILVFGLKNVNILIEPIVVERGKDVIIQCNYDLEDDVLYTVKWYRGQREFYRFSPQESIAPIKKFPFEGVYFDDENSNENQVVLQSVDFNLSGNFSCEVSTDFPFFHTASDSKIMKVVELSERPPLLVTKNQEYEAGDILKATCSSSPSNPPATISFILNKIVICGPCNTTLYKTEGLWLSRSDLILPLFSSHFNTDRLILRCVTKVSELYQQEREVLIYSRPGPISQRVTSSNGNLRYNLTLTFLFINIYFLAL